MVTGFTSISPIRRRPDNNPFPAPILTTSNAMKTFETAKDTYRKNGGSNDRYNRSDDYEEEVKEVKVVKAAPLTKKVTNGSTPNYGG